MQTTGVARRVRPDQRRLRGQRVPFVLPPRQGGQRAPSATPICRSRRATSSSTSRITNPGGDADSTVVNLSRLHLVLGKNPIDAGLVLRTPISDPDVDARFTGTVDLADVRRTVKLDRVKELTGSIAADAAVRTRMSWVDKGRVRPGRGARHGERPRSRGQVGGAPPPARDPGSVASARAPARRAQVVHRHGREQRPPGLGLPRQPARLPPARRRPARQREPQQHEVQSQRVAERRGRAQRHPGAAADRLRARGEGGSSSCTTSSR